MSNGVRYKIRRGRSGPDRRHALVVKGAVVFRGGPGACWALAANMAGARPAGTGSATSAAIRAAHLDIDGSGVTSEPYVPALRDLDLAASEGPGAAPAGPDAEAARRFTDVEAPYGDLGAALASDARASTLAAALAVAASYDLPRPGRRYAVGAGDMMRARRRARIEAILAPGPS